MLTGSESVFVGAVLGASTHWISVGASALDSRPGLRSGQALRGDDGMGGCCQVQRR